jgi:hypothetical protein
MKRAKEQRERGDVSGKDSGVGRPKSPHPRSGRMRARSARRRTVSSIDAVHHWKKRLRNAASYELMLHGFGGKILLLRSSALSWLDSSRKEYTLLSAAMFCTNRFRVQRSAAVGAQRKYCIVRAQECQKLLISPTAVNGISVDEI